MSSILRKIIPSYRKLLKSVKSHILGNNTLENSALVVIDVQERFCEPSLTKKNTALIEIASKIPTIIDEFRKASLPIYLIRFAKRNEDNTTAQINDFYGFTPKKSDIIINKYTNSAFMSSPINELLKENNIKNIIACGVNLTACVKQTLEDARHLKYKVFMLKDLTCNNDYFDKEYDDYTRLGLAFAGVKIINSSDLLEDIAKIKNNITSPKVRFNR